ncbi:MAG TPA: hypothetical protein VFJ90_12705 [Candidatus Didemnitutus sp.]|nr:hypothetical protein [Candidatus Didemnitutus sp.]
MDGKTILIAAGLLAFVGLYAAMIRFASRTGSKPPGSGEIPRK